MTKREQEDAENLMFGLVRCGVCQGGGCIICDEAGWLPTASRVKTTVNKPRGDCEECGGTGKYVGFSQIEPCKACTAAVE